MTRARTRTRTHTHGRTQRNTYAQVDISRAIRTYRTLTKSYPFHVGTLLEYPDFNDSFSRFRSKTEVMEQDSSSSEEDDIEEIIELPHTSTEPVLLVARPKTAVKSIPGPKRLSNDFTPQVKK